MSFNNPILIMCMGRSGSSMTAGVFAQHGVWTGNCQPADHKNPKGYFENIRLKRIMSEAFKDHRTNPRVLPPLDAWDVAVEAVLETEGWKGEPWLVKHSALFWRFWDDFEPTWILPRRDPEQVFRSTRKCGFWKWLDDDGLRECIRVHNEALDFLRDYRGGVEVDFAAVMEGDHGTLHNALNAAGIAPDPGKVTAFVQPELRTC